MSDNHLGGPAADSGELLSWLLIGFGLLVVSSWYLYGGRQHTLPAEPQAAMSHKDAVLRRLQRQRQRCATGTVLDPITAALEGRFPINGLFSERDVLSASVKFAPNGTETGGITPLMWACQWKLLQAQGFPGTHVLGSKVVRALLDAGADANIRCSRNGCAALSFCVKYGDVDALDMLVDAGADPLVCDCYGKNLLFNASECGNHAMMARLLELGVDASATCNEEEGLNAAEVMLSADQTYVSWQVLGPPQERDYTKCFMMMLENGARLDHLPRHLFISCQRNVAVVGEMRVPSFKRAPRDGSSKKKGRPDSHPELKHALADAAVAHEEQRIHQLKMDAAACEEKKMDHVAAGVAKAARRGERLLDAESMPHFWGGPEIRGPTAMTTAQLEVECIARGLVCSEHEQMVEALFHFERTTPLMSDPNGPQELHVETGDTNTMHLGTGKQISIAPKDGPVQIRATVNGISTLCFLSTTSPFTLLSNSFVKRAGISKSRLASKAFVCNGEPLGETRRLRGVCVRIEGVNVTLRTAISAKTVRDVQLGMDFFAQAVHSEVDVFLGGGPPSLVSVQPVYGSSHCRLCTTPRDRHEVLRFHAADGAIAVIPLQHEKRKSLNAYSSHISIALNARLDKCSYCSEPWPGLSRCEKCYTDGVRVPYCSNECARKCPCRQGISMKEAIAKDLVSSENRLI